ncbi:MAG TPA: SUF system Fe-S cluster assembly protein [Vicinamibacterales bacterium]
MKELPVIQPSAGPPPVKSSELQTANMIDDAQQSSALKPQIVKAISTVYDPEIPVNIFDLGLIYEIIVDASSVVGIRMTLTAPGCPAAQVLPEQVRSTVAAVPGVSDVKVDVVWEPPWDRDRMSEAAKLQLGMW